MMDAVHILAAVLASWRITELVTMDRITEPIRRRWPLYLWTCPRCVSVWAGIAVTLAYVWAPYVNWPLAFAWLYLVKSDLRMARRRPYPISGGSTIVALAPSMPFWHNVLDTSRAIDWTQAGIPGGIPTRTTICSTISAATYGNGASDATAGIQAALDACPSGQVVSLSSGTFKINTQVSIPSNVTLRGQGADLTILDGHGTGGGAPVTLGTGDIGIGTSPSITSGATAGSTSIVVSSASGISVGTYLMITELNDASYVTIGGQEGNCTWCDGGLGWNGTRVRGQIVEVTSVSGTTIGFTPGLYSAYVNTPLATVFSASAKYAGVEALQVYANNTGYGASFQFWRCAYCWVRGVESNYTDGDFVQAFWSYRVEIRDNYFSNAYGHSAGSSDSDVFLANKTSASLVQNNIIQRGHVSVMLNWGAAGNVVAYNYMLGEFAEGSSGFVIGGISNHGAHPQFNLYEGNVMSQLYPDGVWGSSSHSTAFRNWTQGTTKICTPLTGIGRGTVNCTGSNGAYPFQASRAMQIAWAATSWNFVGNVVGSNEQNALVNTNPSPVPAIAEVDWPTGRSYDTNAYGWSFGYAGSSDGGGDSHDSTAALVTAFRHGNYNHVDASLTWSGTVTHTLPPSFYLASRPAWFGSVPYPAMGPDVTGGPGPGGYVYRIPARVCYEDVMGGTDSAGSPLAFRASNCYGS